LACSLKGQLLVQVSRANGEPQRKGRCTMGKPVSIGQSHNLLSVLANNVNWEELDSDLVQKIIDNPRGSGRQFTAFLLNGASMAFSMTIKLTENFDAAAFVGQGWSVWRGPADGNGLEGEEDKDVREDALVEVDWSKVLFNTMVSGFEPQITGEEKLRRLKETGKIRLGGRAFLSLWQNYQDKKEDSVLERLHQISGIPSLNYFAFFGTVLRHHREGNRCLLSLHFDGREWRWHCGWLHCVCESSGSYSPAALYEPQ